MCRIPVEASERWRCSTRTCPCEGLQPESTEAVLTASRHFLGLSARAIKQETDPVDDFSEGGRAWRDMQMIDFEIEHRSQ